jgi:hypothetical protein
VASITKRTLETGEVRYLAQVRLEGYPRQSRVFERKTDARRWAQEVESDLRRGRVREAAPREKHTLAELIERYVAEELPNKPAVQALYGRHLAWWSKELGGFGLSNLSSEVIDESYLKLLREPALATPISRFERLTDFKAPGFAGGYLPFLSASPAGPSRRSGSFCPCAP